MKLNSGLDNNGVLLGHEKAPLLADLKVPCRYAMVTYVRPGFSSRFVKVSAQLSMRNVLLRNFGRFPALIEFRFVEDTSCTIPLPAVRMFHVKWVYRALQFTKVPTKKYNRGLLILALGNYRTKGKNSGSLALNRASKSMNSLRCLKFKRGNSVGFHNLNDAKGIHHVVLPFE